MSPQPNLHELSPLEQIRREMQQQERAKAMHPDLAKLHPYDRRTLSRIWAAYVWTREWPEWRKKEWRIHTSDTEQWVLWGFRRKPQSLTLRALRRIRRKLKVPKGATLELVELWQAQRDGPPTEPPKSRTFTTAPDVVDDEHVAIMKFIHPKKRRFKRRIPRGFGRAVKYVAIASPRDHHHTKYLFLGPLMGSTPFKAVSEATELWQGLYAGQLEVHDISKFTKGVRRRMRNGRIIAGVSRLDPAKMFAEESLPLNDGGD